MFNMCIEDIVNDCWEEVIWYCGENEIDESEVSFDVFEKNMMVLYNEFDEEFGDSKEEEFWNMIGDMSVVDLWEMGEVK